MPAAATPGLAPTLITASAGIVVAVVVVRHADLIVENDMPQIP